MTGEPHKSPASGLSLAVSPYRVSTFSPLPESKVLNYLDHVLSWEEAQAREFDEAVMLNERGEIVSGTTGKYLLGNEWNSTHARTQHWRDGRHHTRVRDRYR